MITTRLLRQINAVRCLRLLQAGDGLSRADLARALGQTRATIGHAVAELAEAGLVLEIPEAAPTKPGRPGVALHLNPEGATFIGVEMDARAISAVLLGLDMRVTHRLTELTGQDFSDPAAMQARIAGLAQTLAAEARPKRLHGLGVAVPGLVGREGQVVNAPLLGWRNYPLADGLRHVLPAAWTVAVCNDAFAFASVELAGASLDRTEMARTDQTPSNLLMVLLAEGIGAAHVANGRLVTGAHGFAGELGHMVITVRGRTGKFEDLAGAAGFPQVMRQGRAVGDGVTALLQSLDQPATQAALAFWAEALAVGLANAAHLFDPDRIVLGGPLSTLYPTVAPLVETHLAALMLQGHVRPVLQLARFGAEGAAIGAALRLRERLFTLPDLEGAGPMSGPTAERGPPRLPAVPGALTVLPPSPFARPVSNRVQSIPREPR